jgi:hypothetical protein
LAFEVDEFDVDARHGWSVLVVGPSSEVLDPEEIDVARRQLADGWVPGDQDRVLRITPQRVSGQRVSAGPAWIAAESTPRGAASIT